MKSPIFSLRCLQLAIAIMLAPVADVYAGEPVISSSSIPSYFIGDHWGREALLAASDLQIEEVRKVCARNGRVWALGVNTTFRCSHFEYVSPPKELSGGEPPFYKLNIQAEMSAEQTNLPAKENLPLYSDGMRLFSLKPFPAYQWRSRNATRAETRSVTSLFAKDELELRRARQAFSSGSVMTLNAPDNKATVFLVRLEEHEQTDYGEGNPRYAVVIGQNGEFHQACVVEGYIAGIVDLDGDGIPELLVSTECDGNCEAVISLTKNGKHLISTY